MSLCILLRTPNGGALMAADSAVSTVYEGVPYRVQNEEDHEKVIVHLEHLIFCSGNLERCRVLRQYIRSLKEMDYEAISQFAQELWNGQGGDDSTGILICAPDNSLVGMLSAQGFAVTELPWNKDGLDIDTLGFHMQEAYRSACSATKDSKDWTGPVLAAFNAIACEEVGGVLHIFSRTEPNGKITELKVPGPEPKNMRTGVFVPLTKDVYVMHAIVQANQFLDKNGNDMFTSEGKIAGEYIDARGITIKDAQGNDVVYFDETGIHWNKDYSPIKYQFSTSLNGHWHDTYATNDEYRRESFDGGTTWEAPYKLVGKDGRPGTDGSDASVTFSNIKSALQRAAGTQTSFMTVDEMGAPKIFGGEIYGAKIYAGYAGGVGTGSVISLTDEGIKMTNEGNGTRLEISSSNISNNVPVTAISGGTNGIWMNGQYLYFGTGELGSFKGMGISPYECTFSGRVNFSDAEVVGVHAVLA